MRRVVLRCAAVLALLLGAGTALAAAPEIQALMDDAARHFQARDFEGALAALRKVDAQAELPIVRFNIARCLEELGRPREAADAFDRYLALPDEAPRQKRARDAIAHLESTALGSVDVSCTPADAHVSIRDLLPDAPCPAHVARVPVGTYELTVTRADYQPQAQKIVVRPHEVMSTAVSLTPREASLIVRSQVPGGEAFLGQVLISAVPTEEQHIPPGDYTITVRTPGYVDWSKTVHVAAGQKVELTAEPHAPVKAVPAVGVKGQDDAGPRPLPVLLGAAAGAAFVGGAVFFLRADHDIDRVKREDAAYADAATPVDASAHWSDAKGARDDARLDRALSFAFLGAGVALAGGAVWAYLDDDAPPTQTGVGVSASPGGAWLGYSGVW